MAGLWAIGFGEYDNPAYNLGEALKAAQEGREYNVPRYIGIVEAGVITSEDVSRKIIGPPTRDAYRNRDQK